MFFSTCLSMHMLPVLFALVLIVIADRKSNTRLADTESLPAVDSQHAPVPSIKNYVLLNPTNMNQAVAIYKASRLVMKIIR
jgi:hypothetical protein